MLFWSFMLRRMAANPGGPGVMTFGKSRAKVYAESDGPGHGSTFIVQLPLIAS